MKARRAASITAVAAVLLGVWQLVFAALGPRVLTAPWPTITGAWEMIRSADFRPDLAESARAFLIALAIAAGIGIAGGLAIGTSRAAAETLEPLLVDVNTVPKVALYPVILLALGLGIWSKVVFGALHGVIPIAISAIGAVRNVNPIYVRSGRAMHLTRWQMLRRIWAPACVPEIFTGLRLGFSLTLLGTIFGEFFASQKGVGFRLMNAIDLRDIPAIMSLILILVAFAVIVNAALLALDRRLHRLQ